MAESTALARAEASVARHKSALTSYQEASTSMGATLAAAGGGLAAAALEGAEIPIGLGGASIPAATALALGTSFLAGSELIPSEARPYVTAGQHGLTGGAAALGVKSLLRRPARQTDGPDIPHPRS